MSDKSEIENVGIVGAGLIGSSWATIFSAAGLRVRLFDANPVTLKAAPLAIDRNLAMLRDSCLLAADVELGPVHVCQTVEDAVRGVDYVQESVLETVEVKAAVCAEIDAAIGPNCLVGSSSSGIPASAFTEKLKNRERFFVVHPVNPPHLIPLVEIVPAPWSDPAHIPQLRAFLITIGQEPIVVNREIEGFVLNRLQGALLNEAWALYADGYASLEDIDRTVRAGLGLRWSLMGPFETINLNAPGGIVDYANRLQPLYHRIALSRADPQPWPETAIARAGEACDKAQQSRSREARIQLRDHWLLALKNLKARQDR